MEIFHIWYSSATFHYDWSFYVYAAPFPWRLPIFIGKNFWCSMLEARKKQVPLKSYYSLKIRIDSVNQILKYEEKVTETHNINILTRSTDREILCVYIHVYQIIKNWGPGLYNSLCRADNRKYFSGLSLMQNHGEVHMFHLAREVGKIWRCSCWGKGNFIMINEIKYGQTWTIWPPPLTLSPYSTFKNFIFHMTTRT